MNITGISSHITPEIHSKARFGTNTNVDIELVSQVLTELNKTKNGYYVGEGRDASSIIKEADGRILIMIPDNNARCQYAIILAQTGSIVSSYKDPQDLEGRYFGDWQPHSEAQAKQQVEELFRHLLVSKARGINDVTEIPSFPTGFIP
jgi:hypothetical protein